MIHGTWQQTGGGSGGPPKELIGLAVMIGVAVATASAVGAALAAVMVWLLIGVAAFALAAVAGAVYVVYRHVTGRPLLNLAPLVRHQEVEPLQRQPWILGAQAPKALPQVTVNYYGGHHYHGDADAVPVVRGEIVGGEEL